MADIAYVRSAVESITTLFWLVTFAVLASDASGMDAYYDVNYNPYPDGLGLFKRNPFLPDNVVTAINCSKAAAGLGALEWILFVVTLVSFGMPLHPPQFFPFTAH